jgi:excisionase family DNA binding protein
VSSPVGGNQPNTCDAGPPANQSETLRTAIRGNVPAPRSNGGGQLPAELIAHLVVALSKYLRQLRADGRRVPAEVEALTIFLTDPARALQDVTVPDSWPAAYGHRAMHKRLLITKSDAAELLGVSLRTIERLISAGRLPLVHVEGAARVRVADLEAYVQGLKAEGGAIGSHPSPEGRQ